ncbi:holo-ACP synthase [Candidatus Woesearchaeota archaeon]|nr:holo-ACP synthase [Candidatus Woesearchaeota archaeon]
MRIKLGTDIVYIPRLEKLMQNEKFIKRVFHASECRDYRVEHIAGIFAAKEAFFKAINKKPDWLKIEVRNQKTGRPRLIVSNELGMQLDNLDVSISHDNDYAMAAVSLLVKDGQ